MPGYTSGAGDPRGHGNAPGVTACPVCRSPSRLEARHPDADLWRCPDCDHCFSDPATLRRHEHYGPDYFQTVHANWFSHPHTELNARLLLLIRSYHPGAQSVLDVGCGNGIFLRYLRPRGQWELTGIDLSPNRPEPNIDFLQGDVFEFEPDRRYDVVVSNSVIEHIQDVRGFVSKLDALCAPGGMLLLITPNERSLLYRAAWLLCRLGYNKPFVRLYDAHHLNHFNLTSLRRLLEEVGTVVEHLPHNVPLSALDFPGKNGVERFVQRLGVGLLFRLGELTGQTYLQTIAVRKP